MTQQEARIVCAKWWALQIIHGGMNWNNGDDSRAGGFVQALATILQEKARENITKAQEETFISILVRNLEIYPEARHHVSVDYHPDPTLAEALKLAGIDEHACPSKTVTWIKEKDGDFTVVASLGYQGERVEVTEKTLSGLS